MSSLKMPTENSVQTFDERLGLPSASSMDRLMLCAGAFNMERQFPRCETPSGRRGTKIHAALEGKLPVESLNKSDRISYERHAYNEAYLVEKHGMEGAEVYKEERLWVTDDNLEPLYSAKPDRVYILGNKALVINYKNGFTPQKPIKESWQILTELATVALNFSKIERFIGAFTSPNAPYNGMEYQDCVSYRSSILASHHAIAINTTAALNPKAPRTPSPEACEWCSGKLSGMCPEYKKSLK